MLILYFYYFLSTHSRWNNISFETPCIRFFETLYLALCICAHYYHHSSLYFVYQYDEKPLPSLFIILSISWWKKPIKYSVSRVCWESTFSVTSQRFVNTSDWYLHELCHLLVKVKNEKVSLKQSGQLAQQISVYWSRLFEYLLNYF